MKKYAKGGLKWYDIISKGPTGNAYWQFNYDNVKFGDWEYTPTTNVIMADTGTSMNMLPDKDFYAITNHFFSDLNCYVLKNKMTACDCTKEQHESIPDLTFTINEDKYIIERNQWYERGDGICYIKFMHAPGRTQWILGLMFFQNYYSVMDYEAMRIGFAESKMFMKGTATGFVHWAELSSLFQTFANYIPDSLKQSYDNSTPEVLAAGGLVGLGMILSSICMFKKCKTEKKIEDNNDMEFGESKYEGF